MSRVVEREQAASPAAMSAIGAHTVAARLAALVLSACCLSPAGAAPAADPWHRSVAATYDQTDSRAGNEGVTLFMARFLNGRTGAFGEYDAYAKSFLFKPFDAQLTYNLGPNLLSFVVLPEGGQPLFVMRPLYWSRGKGLGLRKFAVLVDGKLAYERELAYREVDRVRYGAGTNELAIVALRDSELAPLRAITSTSTVSVRLSGSREFVNLEKGGVRPLKNFQQSTIDALQIYDNLMAATRAHAPARN